MPWDYLGYIIMCRIWVDVEDKDLEHAHVKGVLQEQYTRVDLLENEERTKEILDECSSFILVSKNNTDERQCLIDKEIVVELEQEFGECEYFVKDFEKMKEAFYICVNPYLKGEATNEEIKELAAKDWFTSAHYIGTVFMDEDGQLYYGNGKNLIGEELKEQIKAIIEAENMLKE